MATPRDPNQQLERDREQRAQDERAAEEARENSLMNAVVEYLKQSGAELAPADLAAELDADPDAVRHALERAVKEGTVTESHGRYRAAQRD